jgi:hypothetical protein
VTRAPSQREPGGRRRLPSALALGVAACAALAGSCHAAHESAATEEETALVSLRAFEDTRLAGLDFATQAPSNRVLGPDPYAIAALPAGGFVGVLRGSERVVLLDGALAERSRIEAPPLTSALAVGPGGAIFVGGEAGGSVLRARVAGGRLEADGALDLAAGDAARSIRALAVHESGTVYAADELRDALVVAGARGEAPYAVSVPRGPIRLAVTPRALVVASLAGHALTMFRLDADGHPLRDPAVVDIDGPFWSVAARDVDDATLVAAGGVEDHPLDRTGGSFAYIDSYLYLYRFDASGVTRLTALDVGEHRVVTPKALAFARDGKTLHVAGYGAPRGLAVKLPGALPSDYAREPELTELSIPPGVSSMVVVDDDTTVMADPLLDAWVLTRGGTTRYVPVGGDLRALPRTDASRLGEALFFTSLMAPWQKSDGELSRFTCETCHFEGGSDGRTHHTGRGDVVATTKPLLGIFNNAPFFTRALDKNLTGMVHAEFEVASRKSGHSPWFSLDEALSEIGGDAPDADGHGFVDHLVVDRAGLDGSAGGLRRALMAFLMDHTHRPNRAAMGRTAFDLVESEGARVFEERCSSCHAPRLVTNDPRSVVPFEDWETYVLGTARELCAGSIVWARDGYEKTGVEPYVHPDGARPTSLRRLAKKRPYFTNGSAASIEEVLDRARFSRGRFWHDATGAPPGDDLEALGPDERIALAAFLELL